MLRRCLLSTFDARARRAFIDDRSGAITILASLASTAVLGMAALGISVGSWLSLKTSLQIAADQAAYSAALGAAAGQNGYTNALGILAAHGVGCSANASPNGSGSLTCTGARGNSVTINNPPASGSYAGNSGAWEVVASARGNVAPASVFINSAPMLTGRSVATETGNNGNVCILALDNRSGDIHSVFGTASSNVTVGGNCIVAANLVTKNDDDVIDVKKGAVVTFANLYQRVTDLCDGGSCAGTLNITSSVQKGTAAIDDPYASRTLPAADGTCDYTNVSITSTQTIYPGRYCGTGGNPALKIAKGSAALTVTMNPGVYILDGKGGGSCTGTKKPSTCLSGNFVVSGGAVVNGSGVTVVLTSSTNTAINIGSMNVDTNSTLNLTAPTASVGSYDVKGIAIWQDKRAPNPTATDGNKYTTASDGVNLIRSGATTSITGLVYFPSQGIYYMGGNGGNACTQIVAWSIVFNASASFNYPTNCPSTAGLTPIGGTPLVVE